MPKDRSETTLFLIESLDGKISTGDVDELDVDKDFPRLVGVKEGLHQYYEIEKTTDVFSLNSGRVMAKIGVNVRIEEPKKIGCSFIIIDSKPHLDEKGTEYMAKWVNVLYLVTTNRDHPAYKLRNKYKNIEIVEYTNNVNFADLLSRMKNKYNAEKITLQSGGSLNAQWLRLGLVDHVSIVIAPCMIGGTNTQSLVGGESLHNQGDLMKIKALKLVKCEVLKNSYIHVYYDVINKISVLYFY